MRGRSRLLSAGVVLALAATLGACGDDDDDEGAATETTETTSATETTETTAATGPSVEITQPAEGATVASPVTVTMAAMDFTIEPAGDGTVTEGHGHFHLMIDTDCLAPGTTIPSDDTHKHFGTGATETTLELPAGQHTLCLQAGDGAHTALDLTDQVTFTVQ